MPVMFILSAACRITDSGQLEPAMMPVLMWLKSALSKSGCASMAMNIVGTPWKHVIFSRVTQSSAVLGEKYGSGQMVAPCVMAAVIASTMPKQWNMGT